MRLKGLGVILLGVMMVSGCDKLPKFGGGGGSEGTEETASTPPAVVVETPTPAPTPEPTPVFVHDPNPQVAILGYHRFEEKPKDGLAISPEEFEAQMQTLKDAGIEVISVEDFLAWRRGEKNIPIRSAVITIDDGYVSGYDVAWPILKKFDYPFAMYVYMDYISAGGKSITWEQLEEMRDAGVHIGSHSYTHASLKNRKGKTEEEYRAFLKKELVESKQILEHRLGITVNTFVYPYGQYTEEARAVGKEAGYEALFTVYGKFTKFTDPADELGRFIVDTKNPAVFKMALNFRGGSGAPGSDRVVAASVGGVEPADRSVISEAQPLIAADISSLGEVDPASVEMRISGYGLVNATYDPVNKRVSFQMPIPLMEKEYQVTVQGRAGGKRVSLGWNFTYDKYPQAPAMTAPEGAGAVDVTSTPAAPPVPTL